MITTWSQGAPADNMDENILVQLSDIVSRHPWWAARAEIVLALLNELRISPPANILEVGCGWGTNLRILEGAGYRSRPVTSAMAAMFRIDHWRTLRRQNAIGTSLFAVAGSPSVLA
jgi:hypothetical protein